MKQYLVPASFASIALLILGLAVPAQGQFGGHKKGGSQQGGGMCSKGHGGGSLQMPFSQNSSTMRGFNQNTAMQNPYAQNSSMQNPYTQNNYMQNPYAQNTGSQYPYSQANYAQNPYTQNSVMQNPYLQNSNAYSTSQYGLQYPSLQGSGTTSPLDAAQMQYLLQLMQYQAGTTPTQTGLQSATQPASNAQRIQQRRTAAQNTNVQLLRSFSR